MSKKFSKVKEYYDKGFWSAEMVQNAVGKWITAEEADIILKTEE
ncbi:MAG: XkdX family protein [Ruminococcus sp.]|nr:XkdX family protein [Ruminococcus sp.]